MTTEPIKKKNSKKTIESPDCQLAWTVLQGERIDELVNQA